MKESRSTKLFMRPEVNVPGCVNHCGLMRCMVAKFAQVQEHATTRP